MGWTDIFKKKGVEDEQNPLPGNYDYAMQNPDYYAQGETYGMPNYAQPTAAAPQATREAMELKMVVPTQFAEVAAIAKDLKNSRTVVLNMTQVSDATMQRMLDFLSGVAFCLGGQLQPIEGKTYIITPGNIDVSQSQFKQQQAAPQPQQTPYEPMQAQQNPYAQPQAPYGQMQNPYGQAPQNPYGNQNNGGFGGGTGFDPFGQMR